MASLLRPVLYLLLIVLIVQEAQGSWFFGRRRRSSSRIPKPRDCQVGSWSGWSSCSHRCGNAGTQYRKRAVTVAQSWGGRCPFPLRETRRCNRNACQNGGSPARGYCRCRDGFRGTCCEIAVTTTVATTTMPSTTTPPTTPKPTPTSLPCFCYNGGSPVCRSGRLQYCICFRGYHGNLCQFAPTTTTVIPSTPAPEPTTTSLPCFCYNGGSPVCRSGKLLHCICFRGYHGNLCQFAPTTTTAIPSTPFTTRPSTSFPCFCYNGGSPVCRSGRLRYCICFRGCYGRLCRFCSTTGRPFSHTRFITRRPFTPSGSLRCYKCQSSSANGCTSRIQTCRNQHVCYVGQYTLRRNGQRFYVAGCIARLACQSACDNARRAGVVTQCSIRCCSTNLCNDMRRPTNPYWLRFLLKLLEGFKNILDAITALLKAHISRSSTRFHKREIVSMMSQVENAEQQIGDSSEPEVLQAKQDVAETRIRALGLLKKLDDYIDEAPDFKEKK